MYHLVSTEVANLLSKHYRTVQDPESSSYLPRDCYLGGLGGGVLIWGGGGIVLEAWWYWLYWVWAPLGRGAPKDMFSDLLVGLDTTDQVENANCDTNS